MTLPIYLKNAHHSPYVNENSSLKYDLNEELEHVMQSLVIDIAHIQCDLTALDKMDDVRELEQGIDVYDVIDHTLKSLEGLHKYRESMLDRPFDACGIDIELYSASIAGGTKPLLSSSYHLYGENAIRLNPDLPESHLIGEMAGILLRHFHNAFVMLYAGNAHGRTDRYEYHITKIEEGRMYVSLVYPL